MAAITTITAAIGTTVAFITRRPITAGTAIIIIPAPASTFMIATTAAIAGTTISANIGSIATTTGTATGRAAATGIASRTAQRRTAARRIPAAAIGAVTTAIIDR